MIDDFIQSRLQEVIGWDATAEYAPRYGTKGSQLLAIPRPWTLPFLLVSAPACILLCKHEPRACEIFDEEISHLLGGDLIVRSSVVGETIWDRGTYRSISVDAVHAVGSRNLLPSIEAVVASAAGREVGVIVQHFVRPQRLGNFGNLLRISKTRDQWEISTETLRGGFLRARHNSQRDQLADSGQPLLVTSPRERFFGSIAAWLNSELAAGKPTRFNVEWVERAGSMYLVQLDEETEDYSGINPYQRRVATSIKPESEQGRYLQRADKAAMVKWDKLSVLGELWEPEAANKPVLFYISLDTLQSGIDAKALEEDF